MSEKRTNILILIACLFILLLLIGGVIVVRTTDRLLPPRVVAAPVVAAPVVAAPVVAEPAVAGPAVPAQRVTSGHVPMLLAATLPTQPATQLAVSAPSCLGKWSGQWDDTWDVTFTITQKRDTQKLDVLYQWIENPGRPMRRMKLPATLEGNTLHIERDGGNMIDITFSETDPNSAAATGHFRNPRTAALTRQQPAGG